MIKIKDLYYRSIWYKKNFYYLRAGQSLANSTKVSATCQETMQIHLDILDGLKLSDVLDDISLNYLFSKTEISFIRVAENTGSLEYTFKTLSQLLKDQHIQKQKIINAFVYPILIIFMTISLLSMILFFIIPKVKTLFENLQSLPITTRFIIFLSDHLINFWYIDLIILSIATVIVVYKKDKFENTRQYLFSKTPYIKDIFLYWYIERWLQIIYMSLSTGVTIKDSLNFAHESIENKHLKQEFKKIYDQVNEGNTVSNSLKFIDKKIYEKLKDWESIIDSGEKTGKFAEVFEICHMNIKENLENSFDKFQKLIEPILIIFVGIIVMIICISIILPMYQLTQSIQ